MEDDIPVGTPDQGAAATPAAPTTPVQSERDAAEDDIVARMRARRDAGADVPAGDEGEGQTDQSAAAADQHQEEASPASPAADGDQGAAAAADTATAQKADQPSSGQAADADAAPVITDLTQRVKVKIDGVERVVTVDEAIRSFQMAEAARARLDEVNRLRAEAKKALEEAHKTPAPAAAAQQQATTPAAADQVGDVDARVKKFTAAILNGTDEEVEAAVREILAAQGAGTAPAAADVSQVVAAELHRRTETTAYEAVLAEFPEIDPRGDKLDEDLTGLVNTRVQGVMLDELRLAGAPPADLEVLTPAQIGEYHADLRRLGHGTPLDRLLREAATHARSRLGTAAAASTKAATPGAPTSADRRAAKQGLSAIPTASSSARDAAPPPPKRKSGSDIVNEELQARGRAPY